MLARTAEGLYWMSRYLERTQRLCRLLELQAEALVDRPISEIHFGWNRIYLSIGKEPPAGGIALMEDDNYLLADSYTLADDLTFEDTHPFSVWSCFAQGRENARQMRQAISGDMWSRMNLAYLRVRELGIQEIWRTSPENFYKWMVAEIDTFTGIAGNTMYRDEGWHFVQLGHSIERAQLLASLLTSQIDLSDESEELSETGWTSLLRVYHAAEVHNRRYTIDLEPENVLDLLATDALLPGSLVSSIDLAAQEISAIGTGHDAQAGDYTQEIAGRLTTTLHSEWSNGAVRREMLGRVSAYCHELHDAISATYFQYT